MDKVTSTTHSLNINNNETPGTQQAQNNSDLAMPVMKEKNSAESPLQNSTEHQESHQINSNASKKISRTDSKKNSNDENNYIESVATEIKWKIFQHVINEDDYSGESAKSLLAYSETSKANQEDIRNFLQYDNVGRVAAKQFKNNQMKVWNAKAKDLLKNALALKNCWAKSSAEFLTMSKLRNEEVTTIFSPQNLGVEIPFASLESDSTTSAGITKKISAGTVIKFNAHGIGRERVLAEVIPAIYEAAPDCPMIVNLSGNNLTGEDLKPLIAFMAKNPAIYQLDLSDNFFCIDDQQCMELEELFSVLGPVSHLYLSNTGLNDSTTAIIQEHIKNSCLMHLDLRLNQLTNNGCNLVMGSVASENLPAEESMTDELTTKTAYGFIHPFLRAVRLQNNFFNVDVVLFLRILEMTTAINNTINPETNSDASSILEAIQNDMFNLEKEIRKTIFEIINPFIFYASQQKILELRATEEKL